MWPVVLFQIPILYLLLIEKDHRAYVLTIWILFLCNVVSDATLMFDGSILFIVALIFVLLGHISTTIGNSFFIHPSAQETYKEVEKRRLLKHFLISIPFIIVFFALVPTVLWYMSQDDQPIYMFIAATIYAIVLVAQAWYEYD